MFLLYESSIASNASRINAAFPLCLLTFLVIQIPLVWYLPVTTSFIASVMVMVPSIFEVSAIIFAHYYFLYKGKNIYLL